jgi:hypothetical protein
MMEKSWDAHVEVWVEVLLRSRRQYIMKMHGYRVSKLVLASRVKVVWLALAGFFLGSALCPFNPPAAERQDSFRETTAMNSGSEGSTNMGDKSFNGPSATSSEIETATFALG